MRTGSLKGRLSSQILEANMLNNEALEAQTSSGPARKHVGTVKRQNKLLIWSSVGIFVIALALILSLTLTLTTGGSSPTPEEPESSLGPSEEKALSMDQNVIAQSINTFGTRVFEQLAEEDIDAIFLSPWGIAHVLSMLHEGASPDSEARKELQQVIFNVQNAGSASNTAIRTATKALSSAIISGNNEINLTVSDANSAWVSPSLQLLDSYVDALKEYYFAEAWPLTSAAEVNSWVDEATRGKITNLIDEATAVSASLILINAIYFKGLWEVPLNIEDTTKQPFYVAQGGGDATIDVPLMYLQYTSGSDAQAARYIASGTDCIAVKLDYKKNGEDYYAVISMPEGVVSQSSDGGLILQSSGENYLSLLSSCRASIVASLGSAVESQRIENSVEAVEGGLEWMSVGHPDMATLKMYLPRFEIDYSTSLSSALASIGLSSIFSPGNFGGIAENGGDDLAVSDVVHKVYVKVDEQGTEAAAATGIAFSTSMPLEPPKELVVRFDRPFMFSVVNKKTGLALFVGEVYKPEEWEE
jgi:serpin B